MIRRLFLAAMFFLAAASAAVRAQDQGDGTLHVMRPMIHADQEDAEFCLEFDHGLDASQRRAAAAVRLEAGGKPLPVAVRNVSVASDLLCVSPLQRKKEYRFVVTGLRGAKGEKLTSAYSLDFSIPDRKPSLAFTGDADAGGLMRWQDNDPVLRALNIARVRLELYRVTDPAMMTEAWRSRRQTSLAPSESITFAHDHGQRVWKDDLDIDVEDNTTSEQDIALNAGVKDAPPGLYLIAARAPETEDKDKTLATTGAIWLLRSGLRVSTMRDAKGFYALTEKADGSATMKDVYLMIEDANGHKLAEGKSDADGITFFPIPADKQDAAATLSGFTEAGDSDFRDLTARSTARFVSPGNDITLAADKSFYAPGAMASVTVRARDAEGHALTAPDGSLQIAWPNNGAPYTTYAAPLAADGAAHLSFPAPPIEDNWPVTWRSADGNSRDLLLRVTSNPEAPRFEMNADRALLPADGTLTLTLKSLTQDNTPAPYLAGRISYAWQAPASLFPDWKDYRFGKGEIPAGDAAQAGSFITDEKGEATLHLNLTPPDDGALLHAVVLRAQGSAGEGVAATAPMTLPVRPKENIIGVKPLAHEGRFPENGLARFSVIALGPEGRRQSEDDLTYQIYEEGRSFDWHQMDGRWDYKAQQQNRRIGGGALTLDSAHEHIIEWPVTAGSYRLEITDADGVVRASTGFSAGWVIDQAPPPQAPLALTSSPQAQHPGQETRIIFNLDNPSMIDAFIGDDHIRKVIHQPMPKGENVITFTPEKDWGARVSVRVAASDLNLAGQLTLPLGREGQNTEQAPAAKETGSPPDVNEPRVWALPLHGDNALVSGEMQQIEPRQSWAVPAEKGRAKKPAAGLLFIAAAPLLDLPSFLSDAVASHPFSTGEVAGVMETLRLWHETIVAAGFETEPALDAQRQDLLLRLMARQKTDGGFSTIPSEPADVLATAQALVALAHADAAAAKPAAELAAGWLRHRLENTWFDEKERPARAAAYAALAEAGKLDTASLHYFGDTSADKALPPLAAAQLAFAFAASGDQGSASYWLDASGARKAPGDIAPQLFRILAANALFDPQALLPAMEKTAAEMGKDNGRDIKALTGFLRAAWDVQQRKGAWSITVGSDKKNPAGVLVVPEKFPLAIHNTGNDPVFLVRAHASSSAPQAQVVRHIYALNGTETGAHAPLAQGQTYLVVLEGPWPGKESSAALIHDNILPGLHPAGCLPPAPIEADDSLAWLKSQTLTPVTDCEIWSGNVDMTVRKDKGGLSSWRAAYLAKAVTVGTFEAAPASARSLDGDPDARQGAEDRIDIR